MIIHGYSFMFRHRARFDIPDRIISQYDGEKQKKSIIDLIEMGSGGGEVEVAICWFDFDGPK